MATRPSSAFDLLDPRVQRWVWKAGWKELRGIQEEAIPAVLAKDQDVIIASATASGKTEAAFLPIASSLASAATTGLGVLYISPLKALINDQFRRVETLFDELKLPVHRWHGDVASSRKQAVLRDPSGALLITPESLEALFIRRGSEVPAMVSPIQFIVVDELHAFMGSERGRQLQSLLHRVELAARRRIPRLGLSATLGDMNLACDFLRPRRGHEVRQIVSVASGQEVRLQVRGYRRTPPRVGKNEQRRAHREGQQLEVEDVASGDEIAIARDLYSTLRGGRHIVFANRRADVELFSDLLRRSCDRERVPNEFFPHHGSLDKTLREDAEDALRSGDRPATIVATTTLELGIDVGSVESIGQIGPPPSVASMRQRLGRSGRRGTAAVLRIYVQEDEIGPETAPPDRLRADLVQSVAMVRLLVKRWFEPPRTGALHLSTLVQQVLSMVAQHGAVLADQAWRALCEHGPFDAVDPPLFAQVLRDLRAHELITQTHSGEIVLDLNGERLVNHYDFYAAFTSPEEYRLVTEGETLGTLPIVAPVFEGLHLIFGGRRWRVMAVDTRQKVIELASAAGGRAPRFGGSAGFVHDRIRSEMLQVFLDDDSPPFLDAPAKELLQEARAEFRRLGLDRSRVIRWGDHTLLFPWAGDVVLGTLTVLLSGEGLKVSQEGPALLIENCSPEDVRESLRTLIDTGEQDDLELARIVKNRETEKHHVFLSDALLAAEFASARLDTAGAVEAAAALLE
jgi:ATP-dependent Lhr-like helicase